MIAGLQVKGTLENDSKGTKINLSTCQLHTQHSFHSLQNRLRFYVFMTQVTLDDVRNIILKDFLPHEEFSPDTAASLLAIC
jgi:hypothetical protein